MYLTMDANFQQKNYVILFTLLQNIPLTMKQFDWLIIKKNRKLEAFYKSSVYNIVIEKEKNNLE